MTSGTLTVDLWNGTTTTFTISPTATYTEGGAPTSASSLVMGDRVELQVSSSAPTTVTAINIELAMLFGTVTSVSGDTILIRDPQGFTRTILVGTGTTYSGGTLSDIVMGTKIVASGTVDPNGTTLDAVTVKIGSQGTTEVIRGSVTAFTSSSVTVQSNGGTPTLFTFTTNTTFKDGPYTLSASNLAIGEKVSVEVNSSAATTALNVSICLTAVAGVVSSVTGNNVVVNDFEGFARTVVLGTTQYFDGRSAGSISDVVAGAHIIALGTIDTNTTSLDAVVVVVFAPMTDPTPQTPSSNNQFGGNGFGHHHGGFDRHGAFARGRH